jgi:cysteine-rich repeat protein
MHRRDPLFLTLLLVSACGVERLEAIIDMYDTFGTTMTTGATATSTGDTSTSSTSSDTSAPPDTTTGGADAGLDASTADTTTGPPLPVCGDGVVNADDEECDDANDDPNDGCKYCARDRFVFLTSLRYQGFSLEGLYGADQRCRMLAALANLPNFGAYRAWLSDSTTSAAARIRHSRGRYVRVDGVTVADDWDGLVSGQLLAPINVNELGFPDNSPVWTGTLPNGEAAPDTDFCGDWLDAQAADLVPIGIAERADAWWTFYEPTGCGSECPLYCVEN